MMKIFIFLIVSIIEIGAQKNIKSEIIYKPLPKTYGITVPDSGISDYRYKHSTLNISLQTIVGEGMGLGLAIIPFSISFASGFSGSGSKTTSDIFGVITIPAYILGTALGVHLIAHIENKEHSFWKTLEFAAIGGGAGVVLTGILAASYNSIPEAGAAIIALTPLVGSLVYSVSYADWRGENQSVNKFEGFEINNNSALAKDIVEQSQIIKINLFRMPF